MRQAVERTLEAQDNAIKSASSFKVRLHLNLKLKKKAMKSTVRAMNGLSRKAIAVQWKTAGQNTTTMRTPKRLRCVGIKAPTWKMIRDVALESLDALGDDVITKYGSFKVRARLKLKLPTADQTAVCRGKRHG